MCAKKTLSTLPAITTLLGLLLSLNLCLPLIVQAGTPYVRVLEKPDFAGLPYSAMGNLVSEHYSGNTLETKSCTATLISPDRIITAAHCITIGEMYWADMNGPFKFYLGRTGSTTRAISEATVEHFKEDLDSAQDWAILKLEKPLGKSGNFIPLITNARSLYKTKWGRQSLSMAGYASDAPKSDFAAVMECKWLAMDKRGFFGNWFEADRAFVGFIRTNCPSAVGMSGAAMLMPIAKSKKFPSGWGILGVHSRADTQGNGYVCGADVIPKNALP